MSYNVKILWEKNQVKPLLIKNIAGLINGFLMAELNYRHPHRHLSGSALTHAGNFLLDKKKYIDIFQYVNMKTYEDKIVKIAKALSDKTRIRILKEVAKHGGIGLSCGDAEEIAGLSQPTVSHHIKVLVDADLLYAEKNGRCVIISVNKKTLNEFGSLISDSLKDM